MRLGRQSVRPAQVEESPPKLWPKNGVTNPSARAGADVTTRAVVLPVLPVTALVLSSLYSQLLDKVGPMSGSVDYTTMLPVWELAYNAWAEWMYGFSKLSVTSIVPCLVLVWIAVSRRKESPPFFSTYAVIALALLYSFSPYIVTNWFHVNSRLIPYLWMGLLLRVPE